MPKKTAPDLLNYTLLMCRFLLFLMTCNC